jgi:hypothetical protein
MVSIPFSSDDSAILTIGVQSIIATNVASGTASLTKSGGHLSLIDSSESALWLPTDVCDAFAAEFGLIFDPQTQFYILNDTQHDALAAAKPSLTFAVGPQSYGTGAGASIVLPFAAFDYSIAWPFYSSATHYFPIRRANTTAEYRLGRTFLQEAFLTVDYGRTTFNVSQALFPASGTSPHVTPITDPSVASGSPKISTGAIAGVVVGGVLAFVAVISLVVWLIKRRYRGGRGDKAVQHELDGNERGPADEAACKVHEADGDAAVAWRHELGDTGVDSPFGGKPVGTQELPASEAAITAAAGIYELEDSNSTVGHSWRTPVGVGGGGGESRHGYAGGTGMSGSSGDATTPFSPNSLYSDESRRFGPGASAGELPSPLYAPSPNTPSSLGRRSR